MKQGMTMDNARNRGFTLLELLVVMVIIGLLASYVGPRFFEQVGKSEIKATRAQIDAFGKALDTYRLDTGHYPSTEFGLQALINRPNNETRWSGPYLQKAIPLDPWGQAYQYKSPGENGRDYDITSLGKDGQVGGTGEGADINSWDVSK
jgi:general secretion pathway protein G